MSLNKIQSLDPSEAKKGYDELVEYFTSLEIKDITKEIKEEIYFLLSVECNPAAKKKRFQLLAIICKLLDEPPHSSIVIEAMFGTTEESEKARRDSMNLLIECAKLFKKYSQVPQFLIQLKEGLLETCSKKISASMISISRIIFEFKLEEVNQDLLIEISRSIFYHMDSDSRDILKAGLSFAKVVCVFLDKEKYYLVGKEVLLGVFRINESHRKYFRVGIGHVIEGLIDVFTEKEVYKWTPKKETTLVTYVCRKKRRETTLFGKRKGDKTDWNSVSKIRYEGKNKNSVPLFKKRELLQIKKSLKK